MAWMPLPNYCAGSAAALRLGCRRRNGHEVLPLSPCWGLGRGASRRIMISIEKTKGSNTRTKVCWRSGFFRDRRFVCVSARNSYMG